MLSSDRKFEFKEVPAIRTGGRIVASVDPMAGILTAEQEELMPGGHKDIPLKEDVVVEFEGSQFKAQRTSSPDPSVGSAESTFEFDYEGTRYQVVQDEEGDCMVMDGIEVIGPCTVKTGSIRKTAGSTDIGPGDVMLYDEQEVEIVSVDSSKDGVAYYVIKHEDGYQEKVHGSELKTLYASKKVQAKVLGEGFEVGEVVRFKNNDGEWVTGEIKKVIDSDAIYGTTYKVRSDEDDNDWEINEQNLKTASKKVSAMKVSIDCEDMEETRSELKEMFPEGSIKRDGDSGLTISVPYDDEPELKKWLKKNGYEEGMGMETLGQKKVASDEYDFSIGDEFLLDGKKVKIKSIDDGHEWMGTDHDKAGDDIDIVQFTNDPSGTVYSFQELENMIADGQLVRTSATKKTAGSNDRQNIEDTQSNLDEALQHVRQAASYMEDAARSIKNVHTGYNMSGNMQAYVIGHLEGIRTKIKEYKTELDEVEGDTDDDFGAEE